ncbi:hypothetical protein QYM36_004117, partial [Artemia franciscana]
MFSNSLDYESTDGGLVPKSVQFSSFRSGMDIKTVSNLRPRTNGLLDRVAQYNAKVQQTKEKQQSNPFSSEWELRKLKGAVADKSDPTYGRPPAGSLTEKRGLAAERHIQTEIIFLCETIYQYGERYEDGTAAIPFGELFSIYSNINNKLVGLLLRARKHHLLMFEGETLFQRRDDDVPVVLQISLDEIKRIFKRDDQDDKKEDSDSCNNNL